MRNSNKDSLVNTAATYPPNQAMRTDAFVVCLAGSWPRAGLRCGGFAPATFECPLDTTPPCPSFLLPRSLSGVFSSCVLLFLIAPCLLVGVVPGLHTKSLSTINSLTQISPFCPLPPIFLSSPPTIPICYNFPHYSLSPQAAYTLPLDPSSYPYSHHPAPLRL